MSAETKLIEILGASVEVTGIVGERIYPIEAEQADAAPYVVYEVVSSVPVESPSPGQEVNESVVDIACYGRDYKESKRLSVAVRSALIAGFDACVIENTHDQRDSDTRRKSVVQTYRIWHLEEFP
jgi:hypothetical protein